MAFGFVVVGYGQDPVETKDKIYWSDLRSGIFRSDLDGSGIEHLVNPDLRRPKDIALDVGGGKIYWTDLGRNHYWSDPGKDAIYRCNLDGSEIDPVILSLSSSGEYQAEITSIALDLVEGKIYCTVRYDHGDYHLGEILRSDLDGSNVESVLGPNILRSTIAALDAPRGKIYWTNSREGSLERTNLDGTDREVLITGLEYPAEIALNSADGKIYWTNSREGSLERTNLDGTDREVLITGLEYPAEVALNSADGKIYWTTATGTLQRSGVDGSNIETLLMDNATDIALDVVEGKIYWTTARGSIRRSDLNGSNIEDLFAPTVRAPHGFSLDVGEGKIYWTDSRGGTLLRSDLDGSGREVLITGLEDPRSIAVLGSSKIYWTDFGTKEIQRSNLDGSKVETLVTGLEWASLGTPGLVRTEDIALDGIGAKIYWAESQSIKRSDLDGANVETLVLNNAWSGTVLDIALDGIGGRMYWVEISGTIRLSDLDGSNVKDLFNPTTAADSPPSGIALDLSRDKIYWTSMFSDPVVWGSPTYTTVYRSDLDGSNLERIHLKESGTPTGIELISPLPTRVESEGPVGKLPVASDIENSLPNPFNARTRIAYRLSSSGPVRLEIYNTLGQPVRTLVDKFQSAGRYQVRWSAIDQKGAQVAAGVYFARLLYPGGVQTRRLLYLK